MTSLWFDDLNFLLADAAEQDAAIATDGYYFEAAGKDDGTELTNADAIVSTVTSDLFDGASHEVTGWESATLPLRVEIASPTRAGLDAGAARLVATCRKAGIRPLTLTPDGGAPTVYDVVIATWKHEYDDIRGDMEHRRGYMLTLRCKPFARSETAVSLPGLAVGGAYSETVVATGAATTGWSTTSRYVTRRNLFLNPSFENSSSISPWTLYTNTSDGKVITDPAAPDPTKVARITADSLSVGERSYLYSTVISVTPGQDYPFAARIKAGHSGMTTAGVHVAWFDGSGETLGVSEDISVAVTTSAYATISGTLTAPTGAVIIRAYPFVQAGSAVPSGQFWYFDAAAAIDPQAVATTTFFDGDSPASGGLAYHWGSTQGTSGISVETAQAAVLSSGGDVLPRGPGTSDLPINIPEAGIDLTWTGTIDVSAHRYIWVESSAVASPSITLDVDGIRATHLSTKAAGANRTDYFGVPASIVGSAASVTIKADGVQDWAEGSVRVREVATASSIVTGTGRVISRLVSLVGSMPAEASLTVANNGNPLGEFLIVHTGSTAGGLTLLREFRTAGPVQDVSPARVSGFVALMATTEAGADTFEIPVQGLPEATYLLSAILIGVGLVADTTYTFNYRASIVEDPAGTPVEHSITTGSFHVAATGTTFADQPVDAGLLGLPPTYTTVTGANQAVVRIKLWRTAATGDWYLDEAYLADLDNGQISTIDFAAVGLAAEVTALEIIPAAADRPQQQYLATSGTAPNQTVREIVPIGWAAHRFDPADGTAHVRVINVNLAATMGLSVAVEFFPRWDVYAASVITEEA
ncbi:MAG: hypothetical protein ACRDTJ_29215 [Pseudonocardiaceae bacterium]